MLFSTIARDFAALVHTNQRYGNKPYVYHLDQVVKHLCKYGDIACTIGYLHDVLEDTTTTIDDLKGVFGNYIAQCVTLLSDKSGKSRKWRKEQTNKRLSCIESEYRIVLVIKAADRLANLEEGGKIDMYRKEHESFYNAVYRPGLCDEIWEKINTLLKE